MFSPFSEERPVITSPCVPSPCGANAECRVVDNRPVCSCLQGMLGAPPYCRPECVINQDCPSHLACVGNKCNSPCIGSCGYNSECSVHNHNPACICIHGFEGDPFRGCTPIKGRILLRFFFFRSLAFSCFSMIKKFCRCHSPNFLTKHVVLSLCFSHFSFTSLSFRIT